MLFSRPLRLPLRQRADTGEVPTPKGVLLDCRFLPRWVAENHVEAGAAAQEHLGERDREMQRVQSGKRVARPAQRNRALDFLALLLPSPGLKFDCWIERFGGDDVAQRLCRSQNYPRRFHRVARRGHVLQTSVREAGKTGQRLPRLAEEVVGVDREQRSMFHLEATPYVADRADADSALPRTRLCSSIVSGRPGTKVCIQIDSRASSTDSGFRSTP
jgi:hypothetical protein